MRIVHVTKGLPAVAARAHVGEPPASAEVLDGDVVLMDARQRAVVAVQRILPPSATHDFLRRGLGEVAKWENPVTELQADGGRAGGRVSGIYAPHRTFGWVPPVTLRRRYGAQLATFDRDHPDVAKVIHRLGQDAWAATTDAMPTAARRHLAAAEAVAPCWWLGGAPWTSGIINVNNALPYHRDGNNVRGTLSAMLCLRRGVEGGALHLAEYDAWLAVPDRSIITFSGQSVLHGVSPLRIARGGRRFTLVWYFRAAMKRCASTWEGEVARAQLNAATHDHVPDDLAEAFRPQLSGRGTKRGHKVRIQWVSDEGLADPRAQGEAQAST